MYENLLLELTKFTDENITILVDKIKTWISLIFDSDQNSLTSKKLSSFLNRSKLILLNRYRL